MTEQEQREHLALRQIQAVACGWLVKSHFELQNNLQYIAKVCQEVLEKHDE